jgi:hypothetical protein
MILKFENIKNMVLDCWLIVNHRAMCVLSFCFASLPYMVTSYHDCEVQVRLSRVSITLIALDLH